MAGRRVLFAIKRRIERAVGHQRQAVVRLAAVQPCLHGRGDIDQDVLVLIRRRDTDVRGNRCSERRRIARVNLALRPGAVDVINVEAARRGDGIDVELQRGLADTSRRGNRAQIELNVSGLRGAINIECLLSSVVSRRIGGVGVGIAERRDLGVGRTPQEDEQTQQRKQSRLCR